MQYDPQTYKLTDSNKPGLIALAVGLICLVASVAGAFADGHRFWWSYVTAYGFWWTVALGGLFFTMLHHLVNATWSVVVRRLAETTMAVLPFMLLFFIPIIFGMHDLYHWTHADVVATDPILQQKQPYLNTGFFLIRAAFYFVVWTLLAWRLQKISYSEDSGHDPSMVKRVRRISAPGMILFAITTTFASFDWFMSLDPHWFSTIYGAYVFSGATMGFLAFLSIVVIWLTGKGVLTEAITVEHRHDLAKLTFAFVIFWAYMAFSQYFLIWYANIPEETVWFQARWEGAWKPLSLMIVFGHFVVPFLLLITRGAKRSVPVLAFTCFWLMAIHYIDFYWLVMPSMTGHEWHFSWMDLTTLFGIGGVFFWYFWLRLIKRPLVPVADPRLEASKAFINT